MNGGVLADREETLLLIAWGWVPPKSIKVEIERQMDVFGADLSNRGFQFKVLTPLHPVTRQRFLHIGNEEEKRVRGKWLHQEDTHSRRK